ncbi:hypothetical protein SAMN04487904_107161 [Actinopolyspora lacussalsi subsp. righensis]|uniref:Uncharacterized protein n=1 Tax=Actinopolyspora righensis TaxID=995060 RepID=A0A1I7AKF9_9ACTN|nr:hypothetical protein [Actinopolyspora righensis]SFT75459.1 hypothetical protein SAMN04487904_107161 [Actinopolyspora righensis]
MEDDLLEALEYAWNGESGFLRKLRSGLFDPEAGEAYVALLSRIPPIDNIVDSRLIQLIWFAPTFMEWRIERATKSPDEADKLRRIASRAHEALVAILGVP